MLKKVNRVWPIAGGILAPVILGLVTRGWGDGDFKILSSLYWIHLAILMLHEFEEYVLPGGFKEFFNRDTVFALPENQDNIPLNELMITIINLGAWGVFLLAALVTESAPWLGMAMVIFNLVNIIGHGVIFRIKKRGYNPGLVTAVLIQIPFSIIVFWFVITNQVLRSSDYFLAVPLGIITGALLPVLGRIRLVKYHREGD